MLTIQPYDTELDKELQKLAQEDWAGFVALIGEERYTSIKVCVMRKRKKSLQTIAAKFKKTKRWAQYHDDTRCKCN